MGICLGLCGSLERTTFKIIHDGHIANCMLNVAIALWTRMIETRTGSSLVRYISQYNFTIKAPFCYVDGDGKSCFTLIYFSASTVCEKLTDLFLNNSLLKDIKMISLHYQTSSLEALHSLDLIILAPKHISFAFLAIHAR